MKYLFLFLLFAKKKILRWNVKICILDLYIVRGKKMFFVSNSRLLSPAGLLLFFPNIFWLKLLSSFWVEVAKDIWCPQILSNFSIASAYYELTVSNRIFAAV